MLQHSDEFFIILFSHACMYYTVFVCLVTNKIIGDNGYGNINICFTNDANY